MATPPAAATSADAVVVLGAGSTERTLNDASLRRLVEGVRVHREGRAPLLVVLGPAFEGGPAEAGLRARLAAALGVPASAVLAEEGGRTTREEADRVAALLAGRGGRRVLLVTGADHMRRAAAEFRRAGLQVAPVPVEPSEAASSRPEARLRLMRGLCLELAAQLYYRVGAAGR